MRQPLSDGLVGDVKLPAASVLVHHESVVEHQVALCLRVSKRSEHGTREILCYSLGSLRSRGTGHHLHM